jgi:hypothetical protein
MEAPAPSVRATASRRRRARWPVNDEGCATDAGGRRAWPKKLSGSFRESGDLARDAGQVTLDWHVEDLDPAFAPEGLRHTACVVQQGPAQLRPTPAPQPGEEEPDVPVAQAVAHEQEPRRPDARDDQPGDELVDGWRSEVGHELVFRQDHRLALRIAPVDTAVQLEDDCGFRLRRLGHLGARLEDLDVTSRGPEEQPAIIVPVGYVRHDRERFSHLRKGVFQDVIQVRGSNEGDGFPLSGRAQHAVDAGQTGVSLSLPNQTGDPGWLLFPYLRAA